jgi:Arc/MetJ-type ribon-helix-helix transcriptional regulator
MAQSNNPSGKHRLQIELNDIYNEHLKEATKLGEHTSNSQTIRAAIKLYRLALEEGLLNTTIEITKDGEKRAIRIIM